MHKPAEFTTMITKVGEITNEPIGKTLSKGQYANLMQIRSQVRELKIASALHTLTNQLNAMQAQKLSPCETLEQISVVETSIETILNTARASKPNQTNHQNIHDKPKTNGNA